MYARKFYFEEELIHTIQCKTLAVDLRRLKVLTPRDPIFYIKSVIGKQSETISESSLE